MAVAIARSIESVVALWSVVKSGAAFVPVDPSYPAERIEHMLTDSAVAVGITTPEFRTALPDEVRWLELRNGLPTAEPTAPEPAVVHPDAPAYLIYTSGSTGRPKGVTVTHRGIADLVAEQRDRFRGNLMDVCCTAPQRVSMPPCSRSCGQRAAQHDWSWFRTP